jgi:hypothetical protein
MAENVLTVEIRDTGTPAPRPSTSAANTSSGSSASPSQGQPTGQLPERYVEKISVCDVCQSRNKVPASLADGSRSRCVVCGSMYAVGQTTPSMVPTPATPPMSPTPAPRKVEPAADIQLDAAKIPFGFAPDRPEPQTTQPEPPRPDVYQLRDDSPAKPQPATAKIGPTDAEVANSAAKMPRVDDGIELDASKVARKPEPTFDPFRPNVLPSPKIGPQTDADIELDAAKVVKFDMPADASQKAKIADPAAGLELDSAKLDAQAAKIGSTIRDKIDGDPKWLASFEDITDKLARNLLTVQEAQDRIDRLVNSRREEITDQLRGSGVIGVGGDAAEALKQEAMRAAKESGATPQVTAKKDETPTPLTMGFKDRYQGNFRSWMDDANSVLADRKKDASEAEKLAQERNERFAGQVSAVNTGLRAGLQGGATAKIGAGVQVAASGLLGGQAAAMAAGPIGIAAVGAAAAIDTLASAAKSAKQFLDNFAERGEELRGFNSDIATASAIAKVERLQADIRESQRSGREFTGAIESRNRFDIAFREVMQPLERVGARIMTAILNDLTPLLKKMVIGAEKVEDMYDALLALKDILSLQKTPQEAADEFTKKMLDRMNERANAANGPANLLDDFFRLLDGNLQPQNQNPPAAMRGLQFVPVLRGAP